MEKHGGVQLPIFQFSWFSTFQQAPKQLFSPHISAPSGFMVLNHRTVDRIISKWGFWKPCHLHSIYNDIRKKGKQAYGRNVSLRNQHIWMENHGQSANIQETQTPRLPLFNGNKLPSIINTPPSAGRMACSKKHAQNLSIDTPYKGWIDHQIQEQNTKNRDGKYH